MLAKGAPPKLSKQQANWKNKSGRMNRTELIFRQPNDSVIFLSIVKDDLVKKKEETGNGGEIQRFRRNPVCPLARPFSFVCFFL